jgi:hypothetical protein
MDGMSAPPPASGPALRREAKRWRGRRKYGLSPTDCVEMFRAQNGRCANDGCGAPLDAGSARLDHWHDTQLAGDVRSVRAFLCNGCNVALGLLKDDPERAVGLALYLFEYLLLLGDLRRAKSGAVVPDESRLVVAAIAADLVRGFEAASAVSQGTRGLTPSIILGVRGVH